MPKITSPDQSIAPLSRWRMVLTLVFCLGVLNLVKASDTLQVPQVNSAGFLADAGGPSTIPVAVAGTVDLKTLPTTSWKVNFELIDENGVPQSLQVGGNAATVVSATGAVAANSPISANASLKPSLLLDEGSHYAVRSTLFSPSGNPTVRAQTVSQLRQWKHRASHADFSLGTETLIAFGPPPVLQKAWALESDTGGDGSGAAFKVTFNPELSRFDHVESPATTENFTLVVTPRLRITGTQDDLPLKPQSSFSLPVTLASHDPAAALPFKLAPGEISVPLHPAAQLESVDSRYDIVLEMALRDEGQTTWASDSFILTNRQLFHFNGILLAGDISAELRQFSSVSGPSGAGPTGGVLVTPNLTAQGGGFSAIPGWTFGGVSPVVELLADGSARLQAGPSLLLVGSTPIDCGGTPIVWQNATLSNAGATATANVVLPAGMAWCDSAHANNLSLLQPARPVGLLWKRRLNFSSFSLDSNLCPVGGTQRTFQRLSNQGVPEPFWISLEGLPVLFRTESLVWDVSTGQFSLLPDETLPARADEVQQLKDAATANWLVDPLDDSSYDKKSNDDYFLAANGLSGPLLISRDSQGRAVIDSLALNLASSGFYTHYPAGPRIRWSQGGSLVIANGAILATSTLDGGQTVSMSFLREEPLPQGTPPECASGAGPGMIDLQLPTIGPAWTITADGGLIAQGTTTLPGGMEQAPLQWGAITPTTFAFETEPFTTGTWYVPGNSFLHEGLAVSAEDSAAALLLSGVSFNQPERPSSDAYDIGAGDYAGLNLRPTPGVPFSATSRLAGNGPITYSLTESAKYNLRPSGLTGLHEAASFNHDLVLFGFDAHLDSLKLSFLNGTTLGSKSRGSLVVPKPHDINQAKEFGFDLPFRQLYFTSRGGLREALLAQVPDFTLPYWGVPVRPLAMSFAGQIDPNGCVSPSAGSVLLSVEAKLTSLTPQTLRATLAFSPDGDLVSNVAGVPTDSSFQLPSNIKINGPSNEFDGVGSFYRFQPSGKAYLNRYALRDRGDTTGGFISVPGVLHSDSLAGIRVHLHARSASRGSVWNTKNTVTTTDHSGIWIMGGWPMDVKSNNTDGWQEAGNHFFNNSKFDAQHKGFAGNSLASYRRPLWNPAAPSTQFMAKAHTSLLDVVKFESPLVWDNLSRSFRSPADQNINLIVLDTKHRFVRLTPSEAEINFGVTMAGDISAKLTGLLDDYKHERNQLFDWMDQGLRNAAMEAPLLQDLLGGIDEIDQRLSDKVDGFVDPVLNSLIDGPVEQIINVLHAEATKANQTIEGFRADVTGTLSDIGSAGIVPDLNSSVLSIKDQLNASVEGPQELVQDIKHAIHELRDAVSSAKTIMGTPAHPFAETHRHILAEICRAIGRNSKRADGIAYGVSVLGDGLLEEYLTEAEPTFRKIDAVLRDLDETLQELEEGLEAGSDFLLRLVDTVRVVLDAALNSNHFLQKFANDLIVLSKETKSPQFTFPSATQLHDSIKAKLKQQLRGRLYQTVFPAQLQSVLQDHLSQPRDRLVGALDLIFAKAEEVILKALSPAFLQDPSYVVNQISDRAAKLKEILKAASVSGSATLTGHSITHLRLDANLELSVPEPFKFRGWFEFQDYGRSSPARGCIPAGALGASIGMFAEANAELGGKGIYVSEKGFLGLGKTPQGDFYPVSINGECFLAGAVDSGGVKLTDARVMLSLGYDPANSILYDAYLAAKVKGKVGFLTGDVALFMGRACNLSELNLFDEDSLKILNELNGSTLSAGAAFNGVYLNWGGEVNLSEAFGIPRVLLDVKGKRYQSVFGFVRQGSNAGITAGMRLMQNIKGEVFKTASLEVGATGVAFLNVPTTMGNVWSNLSNASLCLNVHGKTEVCFWEFCEDFNVHLKAEVRPADGLGIKLLLPFDIGNFALPVGFNFQCP